MARPPRIEFEDAVYHVRARGNERRPVFRDERNREKFVALLGRSCARSEVSLLSFILLGNHFHLLAQTHRANLSRWMHWLLVSYTTWFNWRHQRSGHLFQGRFKSFVVERESYLLEVSRYIHLNPVRGVNLGAGTIGERRERLRSYKWSSYRGMAGLAASFPFVRCELVLEELGGGDRGAALRYRRFVEEGLVGEVRSPLEAAQWQAVVGGEGFVRQIMDRLKAGSKGGKARGVGSDLIAQRVEPGTILDAVAKHYGLAGEELRRKPRYGDEVPNLAMWLVWERCGLSQTEIGKLFGGLPAGSIAQRLRRISPEAKKMAEQIAAEMSTV
jgi:REP element-mobilizing transposase RayT